MTARPARNRPIGLLACIAVLSAAALFCCPAVLAADAATPARLNWYRGNTHMHSMWSDGDEFPDMAADWYKQHGYQFIALTDHNVLMEGDRWVQIHNRKHPIPNEVFVAYLRRFKQPWVETRGDGGSLEVRLKTYDEIRGKLEEPGKFLMIQGEEITGKCDDKQVHVNALNLAEVIAPQTAPIVAETVARDVAAVADQAQRLDRTILAHVNHPNWKHFDVPPEAIAEAAAVRFFEVCNANSGSSHFGDGNNPGNEGIWDLVNTIRLAEMNARPIYGVASDDTHHYHTMAPDKCNPGRGWIMVRAAELSTAAILDAMQKGDFYATTGVELADYQYDPAEGTISLSVRSKPGGSYRIEFVGTLADFDPTAKDKNARRRKPVPGQSPLRDNPEVGRVLQAVDGLSATYKLTGKEFYVRAVVRSNVPMANPPGTDDEIKHETAWCQPVGWEGRVK